MTAPADRHSRNPDSRIFQSGFRLALYYLECASSLYGLRTGDGARLIRTFWELRVDQSGLAFPSEHSAQHHRVWRPRTVLSGRAAQGHSAQLASAGIASIQGEGAWGSSGVVVSLMGNCQLLGTPASHSTTTALLCA